MLGYVAADILGHAVAEFVDDATRIHACGSSFETPEDSQRYEQTWLRKNGRQFQLPLPCGLLLIASTVIAAQYASSVICRTSTAPRDCAINHRTSTPRTPLEQGHAIVGLHSARTLAERAGRFQWGCVFRRPRASLDGILLVDSQQKSSPTISDSSTFGGFRPN